MKSRIYKTIVLMAIFSVLTLFCEGCGNNCKANEQGPYQANLESLKKHNDAPEWFRDAKLGIYFHWGVYSVPAFGNEWYPRRMHFKDDITYAHHLSKYGHPS